MPTMAQNLICLKPGMPALTMGSGLKARKIWRGARRPASDIEAEIEELPARQREAFLMRYWEEMDVAETAAAMGCSEGSVKTHCFRAVQALSKALKARGIEP
jgi:DNA-directed RNA polymerase specialized sigma24 family protein